MQTCARGGADTPRKLAAILAADIVGFSRLMRLDEVGAAGALREHRAAVDPIMVGRGGRVFKTTGDGVLVEFPSIVTAVEAAIVVQKLMAERNAHVPDDRRMLFRIGINLGDVLIDGDDILGDGVNVAARLEEIAEPGGICVSEDAHRHVQGKTLAVFLDAGEKQLKNMAGPVRVYRVRLDRPSAPAPLALQLPAKPSIAVLPFQNMSGDPEQEYLADGMVEDIITALSRFRELHAALRIAAASNALRGNGEAAARAVTELRALDPELRVSNVNIFLPVRRQEHLLRFEAGLRKAGLPE